MKRDVIIINITSCFMFTCITINLVRTGWWEEEREREIANSNFNNNNNCLKCNTLLWVGLWMKSLAKEKTEETKHGEDACQTVL